MQWARVLGVILLFWRNNLRRNTDSVGAIEHMLNSNSLLGHLVRLYKAG